MSTRRDDRRTPFLRRHRWPRILGFALLLLAAGLITLYALSESAGAGSAPRATAGTPAALGRQVPQIDILGDSYVAGSAEGGRDEANWTRLAGTRFNDENAQVEVNVIAQPGSGYITRGTSGLVFREAATLRLRTTADVVLVFGSRNDGVQTDEAMYEAARALYSDIRDIAPQARVVVIGPVWVDANVPNFIAANNAAMARAAADENLRYIDALEEGWFVDAGEGLIGTDGIHPTNEGHAYLASKVFPLLQEEIAKLDPAS